MKEQLIIFNTAKLAKEKGFDWKVKKHYESNGNRFFDKVECNFNNVELIYSAPSQSLLQKWLREVHNIEVSSFAYNHKNDWMYSVHWLYSIEYMIEHNLDDLCITNSNYKLYEQALEIGLQEALKLIAVKKETDDIPTEVIGTGDGFVKMQRKFKDKVIKLVEKCKKK